MGVHKVLALFIYIIIKYHFEFHKKKLREIKKDNYLVTVLFLYLVLFTCSEEKSSFQGSWIALNPDKNIGF